MLLAEKAPLGQLKAGEWLRVEHMPSTRFWALVSTPTPQLNGKFLDKPFSHAVTGAGFELPMINSGICDIFLQGSGVTTGPITHQRQGSG